MNNTFTFEKKKKLADKISNLKRKEDIIKIFEIIYEHDKNITETQNGLFMIFNDLSDAVYHKIDLYLKSITKKQSSPISENLSEKKEFVSYVKNEFPDQEQFNPKLKYNNREKNIIKRQRYEKMITTEKDTNEGVVYKKFDAISLSDSNSEANKTSPVSTTTNGPVKEPVKNIGKKKPVKPPTKKTEKQI